MCQYTEKQKYAVIIHQLKLMGNAISKRVMHDQQVYTSACTTPMQVREIAMWLRASLLDPYF